MRKSERRRSEGEGEKIGDEGMKTEEERSFWNFFTKFDQQRKKKGEKIGNW